MCVSNAIVSPIEFVVDCRMFLDSNALGLTVAALSSYDPHMRAAAYHVLVAYYSHLEGARFPEQSQVSGVEGAWQTLESWLSMPLVDGSLRSTEALPEDLR